MRGSSYKENSILHAPLLHRHPRLFHLFSTKMLGVNSLNEEQMQHFRVLDSDRKHLLKTVLESEFKLKSAATLWPRQTHGKKVGIVTEQTLTEPFDETDALITSLPGVFIGVKTADCVPVLLYDSYTQTIAAVHSGWRGTVQNIVAETLLTMQHEYGTQASNVWAAIGPCISMEHYEVGPEVRTEFENQFQSKQISEVIKPKSNGKILLNLKKAIEFQLRDWGLPASQIDCMEACTFNADDRFYSARRDGTATGRMINGVMLLP
jgi:polyphenol oxidase